MMKKRLIFTLLLAAFIVACFAQKPYKVMFYNLENFFDTINDPEVLDDEFTPKGPNSGTRPSTTASWATSNGYCSTLRLPTRSILP